MSMAQYHVVLLVFPATDFKFLILDFRLRILDFLQSKTVFFYFRFLIADFRFIKH